MAIQTDSDTSVALKLAGIRSDIGLLAMHLSEVETETDGVLDLLVTLRSYARQGDAVRTEETLAELVIALEHLLHHTQAALPILQRELGLDAEAPEH
jgi:hypothetical protein